nr:immunoglobulin light chain junction region [Macaca mulatta]MOV80399.1 immunoglobulin light chain junction region [Macaca mulatta]MOV80968.1 immunoglobulin light chain junction region [Macaca mulatta]MOV81100.1 immunoglobulin light chain junction region [Macaca mulatta]MOV82746.1 immunoglobulin light chain junction region [Macaca mulatta]
CQQYESDSLTF